MCNAELPREFLTFCCLNDKAIVQSFLREIFQRYPGKIPSIRDCCGLHMRDFRRFIFYILFRSHDVQWILFSSLFANTCRFCILKVHMESCVELRESDCYYRRFVLYFESPIFFGLSWFPFVYLTVVLFSDLGFSACWWWVSHLCEAVALAHSNFAPKPLQVCIFWFECVDENVFVNWQLSPLQRLQFRLLPSNQLSWLSLRQFNQFLLNQLLRPLLCPLYWRNWPIARGNR